jgi:threonine dehydrogenase-like Zn-dependent dehydrogenase
VVGSEVRPTARAAVMVGPGRVELREFALAPPRPGWVLLRILRSGICGTDLHTFRGETLQYAGTAHERRISYPVICGHENVGVVAAVGGQVVAHDGRPLRPGERVVPGANVACGRCAYCRRRFPYYACQRLEDYGNSLGAAEPPYLFGGWSEYLYVMPGSRLFRVPEDVSNGLAALTELYSVTHGLDRVDGTLVGATVYVLGCGPLGLCHIARARLLGATRVIAVDRFPLRLEMARKVGAAEILPLDLTTRAERLVVVRAATEGLGADVAVDAAGAPEAFAEGLAALRFRGTLIEAGAFTGTRPAEVDVAADITLKDARIIGVGGEDDAAYPQSLRDMAERGEDLALERIVTHVLPLDRVAEGIDLAIRGEAVKVQLDPDGIAERSDQEAGNG